MFDQLRWPWEYEPIDLAGYIPDFVIGFRRGRVLVEVKPELEWPGLQPHAKHICEAGWRGDFLVVGARLFDSGSQPSFGLSGVWDSESDDGWWAADHAEAVECLDCDRISFRHASGGWWCAACGSTTHARSPAEPRKVRDAWGRAGNAVQWRSQAEVSW